MALLKNGRRELRPAESSRTVEDGEGIMPLLLPTAGCEDEYVAGGLPGGGMS